MGALTMYDCSPLHLDNQHHNCIIFLAKYAAAQEGHQQFNHIRSRARQYHNFLSMIYHHLKHHDITKPHIDN